MLYLAGVAGTPRRRSRRRRPRRAGWEWRVHAGGVSGETPRWGELTHELVVLLTCWVRARGASAEWRRGGDGIIEGRRCWTIVNEARTIPSPMLGFWESRLLFLFLFLSSVGAFGCWSLSSTSTTHLLVFRSPGNGPIRLSEKKKPKHCSDWLCERKYCSGWLMNSII